MVSPSTRSPLSRILTDDDWPAVVNSLQRAWKKRARLTRVLIREGADAWTLRYIYSEVVQLVIIYGL